MKNLVILLVLFLFSCESNMFIDSDPTNKIIKHAIYDVNYHVYTSSLITNITFANNKGEFVDTVITSSEFEYKYNNTDNYRDIYFISAKGLSDNSFLEITYNEISKELTSDKPYLTISE